MAERYDFIVIGSGFGGSVSALRLAEKGYRVAVLEAGMRFEDADLPKTSWSVFRYLWLPVARCFGIFRMTLVRDVLILSGTGVGGGSLGYANTLLRPPDPFYEDPQWAGMADWKQTLAPHFDRAGEMLGIATNERMTRADELIRDVAEEIGCEDTFQMQDVGVYFGEPEVTAPDPYFDGDGPERTGCKQCGGCMTGCRHNAKNTLPKNYLYLAEQRGVEIVPETTATLIREEDGGYAVDTYRTTSLFKGGRRTFRAKQVVLAAGVLGTLPLLFESRDRGTLPRLSPTLGARARTNSEALYGVTTLDGEADYSDGVAITSSIYIDEVTHIEPVRYSAGSDLLSAMTTHQVVGGDRARPWRWFLQILRHPIQFLRLSWPFGWAKRSIILLTMQTLDNSIRLFRKRPWWWPFSRVLTSERDDQHERIPAEIPQAQTVASVAAEKMGGYPRNAINEVVLNMGTTAHILGGCAIGPDAESGVIDGQNRVYGHDGLYVIDGSMMPANLGVNPSLTITAMAEHAMSHVPERDADRGEEQ